MSLGRVWAALPLASPRGWPLHMAVSDSVLQPVVAQSVAGLTPRLCADADGMLYRVGDRHAGGGGS